MFVPGRGPKFTEPELRVAVAASQSVAETLRRLRMAASGGNPRTVRKYASLWSISIAHFDPHAATRGRGRAARRPLAEILVEHSTYSRGHLKERLFEEGIKFRVCEICGQDEEWHGRRMSLILDHANGVRDDNRIENLRIVCPNCAATLDTHCGKNKNPLPPCAVCGTPFRPDGSKQRHCSRDCGSRSDASRAAQVAARCVERPPYEQLLKEIAESSYVAVGRRYGVSDNAIRKWLGAYEREREETAVTDENPQSRAA